MYIHEAQAPDNPRVIDDDADDQMPVRTGGKRKPRVLLELPPDLKEALDRSAFTHARSRTAEVVLRLRQSFERDGGSVRAGGLPARERAPAIAGWLGSPAPELADEEQQLVALFRRLNATQRAALLQLLS